MTLPGRVLSLALVVTLLLAFDARAYAQVREDAAPMTTWVLGVSTGLWDVTRMTYIERRVGVAFDATVEHRIGPSRGAGDRAVRLQVGTGRGDEYGGPGFDFTRVTLGVVRQLGGGHPPFTIQVAAGGGAYALSSRDGRRTRPSVFGAVGWDAKLGTGAASLHAEAQLLTIGSGLYGSVSVGLQAHLR
jgi:hypothetical protein